MFKKTTAQMELLGVRHRLGESSWRRLRESWAEPFHDKIYPLLLEAEESFADLYDPGGGRTNWSVARILALSLLQEMHDLCTGSA